MNQKLSTPGQVTPAHLSGLAGLNSLVCLLIARSFHTFLADWHMAYQPVRNHLSRPCHPPQSLVNLFTTTITTTITNKILLVYCQLLLLLLLLIIITISRASQQSAESLLSQAVLDQVNSLLQEKWYPIWQRYSHSPPLRP